MKAIGDRLFGPLLLLTGVITLAPIIGDIPGVPTIMGMIVFLLAIQLLFHREHLWLPQFLLKRSIERDNLHKAVEKLRPAARFVDRFLRPRLTMLTKNVVAYVIAFACLGIALAMPVMEVVPFSANIAGAALTLYGLALIAHDGLLALIAFALTSGIILLVVLNLT